MVSEKTGSMVGTTRGAFPELCALCGAAALDVLLTGVCGVEGQQGPLVSSLKGLGQGFPTHAALPPRASALPVKNRWGKEISFPHPER